MIFFVGIICFFFSSRRRHTRLVSDWSSDVCSSDLQDQVHVTKPLEDKSVQGAPQQHEPSAAEMSRSEERRVGKSVDLGGRRIQKKKKRKTRIKDAMMKNEKQSTKQQ